MVRGYQLLTAGKKEFKEFEELQEFKETRQQV
jgi:hypothetical protein